MLWLALMSSLSENLGRRIAQLREERGFDREELSERVGLSPSGLGYLERGATNTRTEVLERLAVALDVDPADLFVFPWAEDEGEDPSPRQYARELVRVTADPKVGGLLKQMQDYVARHTPVVGLLGRRRAR
jgi:transcriptional regulator with XRE-family HTH domain